MYKRTLESANFHTNQKDPQFFKKAKSTITMAEDIINTALKTDLLLRKEPAIERVINVMKLLKRNELLQLLKKMNYSFFDWAVQNNNLLLFDALVEQVEPYNHFLMLEHDNYLPLQKFIQEIISMPYKNYKRTSGLKSEILIRLINLGAGAELLETVIEDAKAKLPTFDNVTLSTFQEDLAITLQSLLVIPNNE